MNSTFVSVVIPTYNEGGRIEPNLEKIIKYLNVKFAQFEVIAVDDGSRDDTPRKIAEVARKEPRVRHFLFSTNRGKGFVVREGILKARGDVIFFTDADLSTPVEEIEKAVQGLSEGYPVIIASRRHEESVIRLRQNWFRGTIGRVFNLLVRILLTMPLRDTQCGFKGFSRQAAQEIFSRVHIEGFAFDAEVLLIARRLGYSIKEIPVCWTNSPESKVRPLRHSLLVVGELLRIYWNDRKGLYDKKNMST
jgi:dolichyl-phosphate beta-glucosyltransferase